MSRSIILAEGKYSINLQLETFDPYNSNPQATTNAISDVVHALGTTVRFPKRPLRGQFVTDTPEEIFYSHLAHLPSVLDDEINSLEEEKCTNLIRQVRSESVIEAHARAKKNSFLFHFCNKKN